MRNIKAHSLRGISTRFLQVVVVLIAMVTLALMLWEPHLEGRNANATPFEIYFKDPFLAYVYFASFAYFVALYQAFKLLGYAGQSKVISQEAVNALKTIKYCAILLVGFIVGAVAYIIISMTGKDDIAGGVMLGLIATFATIVVGTAAAVFQRVLQNAVDIKSENDLTV